MRRAGVVASVLAVAGLTLSTAAHANPAVSLDPTFGSGGVASAGPGGGPTSVTQPDGKVLLLAAVFDSAGHQHWFLARLTSAGQLDSSFGTGGRVCLPTTSPGAETGLALDRSGRIIVSGNVTTPEGGDTTVVLRRLPDGRSDPTFGDDGSVQMALTGPQQRGLGVLASGEIIVEGSSSIVSLSSAGAELGEITPPFVPGAGGAGVLVQGNKFVVAGGTVANNVVELERYTSSLAPDPDFNDGQPVVETFTGVASAVPNALIGQRDDSIIMAGNYGSTPPANVFVFRYHSNGAEDPSLRYTGQPLNTGPYDAHPAGAVSEPDNSLIVMIGDNPSEAAELMRFNPDGTQDLTFGTGGLFAVQLDGAAPVEGMSAYSAGKVIVVGQTAARSHPDVLAGRFLVG